MDVLLVTPAGAEERTPEELDALLAKTRDGSGLLWVDVPSWDDQAASLLDPPARGGGLWTAQPGPQGARLQRPPLRRAARPRAR
jgi:hypothetical protein